jgi:spermine/spermidine synthase
MPTPGSSSAAIASSGRDIPSGVKLAAYSALILFLELAFIRYTSAYVRVFGFYLNFVLIATFLGMGVGLLRAELAKQLKWIAVPAILLLFGAVAYFGAVHISVPDDKNEFLWGIFADTGPARTIPMLPVVTALFALTAIFFVPLGALLGVEFGKHKPLRAYTFDIAGSLAGIAAFGALSATRQPPLVWFACAIGTWVLLSVKDWRYATALGAAGLCALTLATWSEGPKPEYWSPYYRINLTPHPGAVRVDVNGSLHQFILDLDPARAPKYQYNAIARPAYVRPYALPKRLDTALVVGAGTGNDVALLLQHGARHIDAVEIDPVIADIGRAAHYQQPYSDPRVHLHIDDARAFMRKAHQQYDVIVFGTLDSQTLLSGMSSVRLDNYVYTLQSFESAHARLKPEGTLIAYHMSAVPYIAENIYQMLDKAFGKVPGVWAENDQLFNFTFVAGYGAERAPKAPGFLTKPRPYPTDDWPYLYLRERTIPSHYLVALGGVLVVALLMMGIGGGRAMARGVDGAMFLMGTGFLLVETKSVTEMSLLFGSTWTVNLLVFASILVMVLVANLVVLRRPPLRTTALYGGLLASLGVAYLLPASSLLWLGTAGQWLVGGLMVALPVFFASLIFSTLLQRRGDATRALAYNLLGAIVGGVLEYSSMALGIKALYLIAAATYVGAMLIVRRQERGILA